MDPRAFSQNLVDEMESLFARLGEEEILEAETEGSEGKMEVATLLRLAMGSELEAAELAALWLPTTPEIDAKVLFSRQCADEMKHHQLIADRLRALGEDPDEALSVDLSMSGPSPLFHYLKGLRTTIERVTAGLFTTEAIAQVRNAQFIGFCRARGDVGTATLYEDIIQPEEEHHHLEGRYFLERHAVDAEAQELARAAMRNTLAIADELRTLAEKTTGIENLPVS